MQRSVQGARQRRGATITIVALSTAAILAMGAITVDLGMLFKVRGDAQRTADAAALAGASAFIDGIPMESRDEALKRTFKSIGQNYVGGHKIDTTGYRLSLNGNTYYVETKDATIEIAPNRFPRPRVRVQIRRANAPSLFGKILGVNFTRVQAYAAAEASDAGGSKCVKPFALADTWNEATAGSDANGNRFWDNGENWEYNADDSYGPWDGAETDQTGQHETGYGSSWRDQNGQGILRDRGRQLIIKPQNPQVDQVIKPGHFFAWDMPDDPSNEAEGSCPAGGGNGAHDYEHSICSCNDADVFLNTEYDLKPGNMVGPTKQGIETLVKMDPAAKWSPTADGGKGGVTGSKYSDWRDSPRVIKVALYDPALEYKSGRISVKFNNIALMFVEDYQRAKGQTTEDAVIGRFLTFAAGSATPGPGGPLAKVLRLVE